MACGLPGLSAVLARGCAADLECMGVEMAVHEQQQTSPPTCQPCDSSGEEKIARVKTTPESWKLTQQQQAFIDLFNEDEQPKQ